MIYVCPITKIKETVAASRARRMVSLLAAGTAVERPPQIEATDHLHLSFHDIVDEQPDMTPPGLVHVEALLGFARAWDRAQPLLIHCYAGISRSTAAAYIVAAALNPSRDEAELAGALRLLSPSATPNLRLVSFADGLLGRQGRMVEAVRAIGRGEEAFEGLPFALKID